MVGGSHPGAARISSAHAVADDLPVIRDNIRKGFLETQSKVNSFISTIRKRLDGDEEEEEEEETPPPQPPRRTTGGSGWTSSGTTRRSAERERYDADPHVLSDDFAAIHMHDDTSKGFSERPSRAMTE